ncbi:MAG: helix-turn-helix domain-containing protein [Clostridia bacterium]|nr:MAG: helix-turn-helix domain-containing protein [Clostridia bacterium]
MQRKPKLRELIVRVKNGEEDAVLEVVQRFIPLVRKYSRRMGYDEACSDLVVWIVSAVHRYEPRTTWGRDELQKYFASKRHD